MTTEIEKLETQPENDAPVELPQRPILGHQKLTDEQVTLINIITEKGNEIGSFIHTLGLANQVEPGHTSPYDERWLEIGKTHIQEGLMAIRRSIAKPTSF